MNRYFSTFELTRGFFIALLASVFLYTAYWGHTIALINTLSGLTVLYLLLQANTKVWFFSGFFIGVFWFWWISLSFIHYNMPWAIPIVVLAMGLLYAVIFAVIAFSAKKLCRVRIHAPKNQSNNLCVNTHPTVLIVKALGLLTLSYLHPFGFDWFKPELMFVHSYLGIEKWQFALLLTATLLTLWKKQWLFMSIALLALHVHTPTVTTTPENIALITTHTTVKDKWNKEKHRQQFEEIFETIDSAIADKKTLIILPESVFPVFLNYDKILIGKLKARSEKISIVLGGLFWDGTIPHNSAYVFTKEKVIIAHKVLLVPFGESNPLPDFLSDWVNKIFYDGAIDYKASNTVVDYTIDGITYRNAICFEGTSEKLYEKGKDHKRPKHMILLSNNGWFTPSVEPTLQRVLLQYYSQKYGTTIYHSINMSPSYVIQDENSAKK